MKQIILSIIALISVSATFAQTNPIIPNRAPKKAELPVPTIATIKPDLTVEIENVSGGSYNTVTKKTSIKVMVVIRNNSDAAAPASKIAAYAYHHSSTNPDHVFWHIGDFKDAPAVPANGVVRRLITFQMEEMPGRTVAYPFKVEIDKRYTVDEANETNNDSNQVEIMVPRT